MLIPLNFFIHLKGKLIFFTLGFKSSNGQLKPQIILLGLVVGRWFIKSEPTNPEIIRHNT